MTTSYKTSTTKDDELLYKYICNESIIALVKHNQAQKCLQINSKPLH